MSLENLTCSDSLATVSKRLIHSFCIPSSICASGSGGKAGAVGLGFPNNGVGETPTLNAGGDAEGEPALFIENGPPGKIVGLVAGGTGDVGFWPNKEPAGGVVARLNGAFCTF